MVLLVVILHVPLGNYMARVYSDTGHWRVERLIYRLIGAQPDNRQRWSNYGFSLLAFSAVSVLFLYGLLLAQTRLPEPWGHKGMTPALAFNTAISFVTNTSWQNYPGESTLGHVGLVVGLGVQAFVSCAVGMCVAAALIRGLAQYQNEQIGNFWADLVRSVVRVLLPLSVVVTLILLVLGVVNNFHGAQEISTLAGGKQTILGGPVAAWESIKLMSGDGGGAFNVNSAHPFENPTPLTNVVEIVAMLLVPVAFLRTFGVMVGDKKQGWALFSAAAMLFVVGMVAIAVATSVTHGTVVHAVGAPARRYRDPVRRARQCTVRTGRDGQRRRCRELVLRQLRQCRGCSADAEHDAGRGGTGWCGQRPVRPRDDDAAGGVPRWIDDREDARVPQAADGCAAHEAGQPLHPGAAGGSLDRNRGGHGAAG